MPQITFIFMNVQIFEMTLAKFMCMKNIHGNYLWAILPINPSVRNKIISPSQKQFMRINALMNENPVLTKNGIRPEALSSSKTFFRAEPQTVNLSSEETFLIFTPPINAALSTDE